jgi:hypothetical protein
MTIRHAATSLLVVGIALVLAASVGAQSADTGHRTQPEDLTYLGAFRLPEDAPEDIGWSYSGHAMAYYPDGDPDGPDDGFPGSIFGTGHDWYQYISEISIPPPVISPSHNPADLNVATTLQPFTDVRGEMFGYLEQLHAGLAYLPPQDAQSSGKLVSCWGQHFQEGEFGPSHGWCELDLSNPQVAGPWYIDELPVYVTNNYLFPIAPDWAAAHTPGQVLATGRFREGGQVASGPSLVAIGPWDTAIPPAPESTIPATTLLRYDDFTAPEEHKLNGYHHSDEWAGGAWLTAGDRSAVIFVGTKGLGECWYGFANGVVWPEEPPYPEVPEYPFDNRGFWSSSFEAQSIFYDPDNLAAVARGEMEPWQPQPYATLSIDDVLFGVDAEWERERVRAASFDPERGLLYVFEPMASEDRTLIHVWHVE